jgi:hypothetical protein
MLAFKEGVFPRKLTFITLQAFEDCVLPLGGGPDGKSPIFIPKGGVIVYSVWAMGRNKQFFGEDALEFRPERWETLRPGWEYLPFNGGPRICIGRKLLLTVSSQYELARD